MCQKSLYYLCKEVLGYKDMNPDIHGDFAEFLTSPEHGRFRQGTLPRSFFKTWVGTVGFSIWIVLPDEEGLYKDIFPFKGPNARLLIASNVIDNAARMVHKIKQEFMSNPRLRAAFPELIPDFNKVRWSDHAAEIKRTINATEATYTAVGVGGSVISQHFDMLMEDDLIYAKKDDFTGMELMPSQEDIDNAIGWHKLSFSLLADPRTGCIFNIGTRWAPKDLIYYIRTFEKQYKCFEVAAEYPEQGIVTWPERYPREVLDQIKATQGVRIYETQYLNMPRATEDILFRREYVQIHESLVEYPTGMTFKTIVDLAGWGDSKGLARNAIVTCGIDERHHVWVARIDVGKFTPTDVIRLFKEHSRQFKSKIFVEEVQYQRAIRHFSREEMERTGEFFTQEQLPYDNRKGAKDLRIRALEPLITNGGLHILTYMTEVLEELEFYPHSTTVDILDCLGYYVRITRKPVMEQPVERAGFGLSFGKVLDELEGRKMSCTGYPFESQIKAMKELSRDGYIHLN